MTPAVAKRWCTAWFAFALATGCSSFTGRPNDASADREIADVATDREMADAPADRDASDAAVDRDVTDTGPPFDATPVCTPTATFERCLTAADDNCNGLRNEACSGQACPGMRDIWTCSSTYPGFRVRCPDGGLETDRCPVRCVPQTLGSDDLCR